MTTLSLHREIPYPQSKLIKQLHWESEPSRYPGSGTDMHWWTWGIDSSIYVIDDDGANFGGPGMVCAFTEVNRHSAGS
jgi:hypothetical protein